MGPWHQHRLGTEQPGGEWLWRIFVPTVVHRGDGGECLIVQLEVLQAGVEADDPTHLWDRT